MPWTISPSASAMKSPSRSPPSTRNSPATATSSPASVTPATSPSATNSEDYPLPCFLKCKTPRFTLFLCSPSRISAKRLILHLSHASLPVISAEHSVAHFYKQRGRAPTSVKPAGAEFWADFPPDNDENRKKSVNNRKIQKNRTGTTDESHADWIELSMFAENR